MHLYEEVKTGILTKRASCYSWHCEEQRNVHNNGCAMTSGKFFEIARGTNLLNSLLFQHPKYLVLDNEVSIDELESDIFDLISFLLHQP